MSPAEIEHLWYEYHPKVYGYFLRRLNTREDVEDLTSMTLTIFVNHLRDEQKTIEHPHAFLWKIAYNQLLFFVREKRKNPISIDYQDEFEGVEDQETPSPYLKERIQTLMNCVDQHLHGQEQQIITRIVLEDQKSPTVAKEIGLTAVNVRQKLARALAKLRQECKQIWFA